jgi:hypothetical protein
MAEYVALPDGSRLEIPADIVSAGRDAVGAFVETKTAPAKGKTTKTPTEGSE